MVFISSDGLLIFCSPTVAVMQWKNEIEAHSEGLSVLVWHGASRETNAKALKKYDVVRICSFFV